MPTVDYGDYTITTTPTPAGLTETIAFKPGTRGAISQSLAGKAQAAITANNAYLALPSPSAAQTTAQVQRVTRECNAVIRLLLGMLDADDA